MKAAVCAAIRHHELRQEGEKEYALFGLKKSVGACQKPDEPMARRDAAPPAGVGLCRDSSIVTPIKQRRLPSI